MNSPLITLTAEETMMNCIREQQSRLATAEITILQQQIKINRLTAELKSAQETAEQTLDRLMELTPPMQLNPTNRDGDENAV